ncbi:MAG TPA: ribonuclease HII [Candidatus Saccharimonadales bacterium]|nr:ribonuclease HII [Candidatus Saccharimonadales bacterium]
MTIVGIDEVGRGCWAGPLVAAAVVLARPTKGLKDSKKLPRAERERLAKIIHKKALATGIGWVPAAELDEVGLTEAVRRAMQRALEHIGIPYDKIIIDGNYNYLTNVKKTEVLIKADDLVPAVSAASIIAKVARDQYMAALDGNYKKYQFAQHVGYGTPLHQQLLAEHGISDIHRRLFKPIQSLLDETA